MELNGYEVRELSGATVQSKCDSPVLPELLQIL